MSERRSEFELQIELHSARRLGRNRAPEKRRGDHPNVSRIVDGLRRLKEFTDAVRVFACSRFFERMKSRDTLKSRSTKPGPASELRSVFAGRSLTTPSRLVSLPVVTFTGNPEYSDSPMPH